MGRPEKALDPEAGPLQRFAGDLRRLRRDAGSPTYRELSHKTQYSTSVLSRAASGRDLPSLAVTLAYARACGGDASYWRNRWQALALTPQPHAVAAETVTVPAPHAPLAPGGYRLRMLASLGILTAVTAAAVGSWVFTAIAKPGALRTGRATTHRLVPTGDTDPDTFECEAGAVTLATAKIAVIEQLPAFGRPFTERTVDLGKIQLRYSRQCHAVWALLLPTVRFDHVAGYEVVGVIRLADGKAFGFSSGHIGRAQSQLLRVGRGCVIAYATLIIAGGYQANATTLCPVRVYAGEMHIATSQESRH